MTDTSDTFKKNMRTFSEIEKDDKNKGVYMGDIIFQKVSEVSQEEAEEVDFSQLNFEDSDNE